jgi:hypothetical protein
MLRQGELKPPFEMFSLFSTRRSFFLSGNAVLNNWLIEAVILDGTVILGRVVPNYPTVK